MRGGWGGLVTALALAACATTPSPQATISAFEIALTTADQAALVYTALPSCGVSAPGACSDQLLKARIKSAAEDAYTAVKSAEATAAQGGAPDTAALIAAIQALQSLIPAQEPTP